MEYTQIFDTRANQYTYAVHTYPHVLQQEFETAVQMLDLQKGEHLINIPAACICIDPYISSDLQIQHTMYETSKTFADLNSVEYCEWHTIPWQPESCDKILSLASLHHANQEERNTLYRSAYTALRPGGALVIGDVRKGSKQDPWLNSFVNEFNPSGHCGNFWSEQDAVLIQTAGFEVSVHTKKYLWKHKTKSEMLDFCKNLFGLDKATETQIYEGLLNHGLIVDVNDMEWELMYFIAQKPKY
jgi:SAM-dependent methyltransferase